MRIARSFLPQPVPGSRATRHLVALRRICCSRQPVASSSTSSDVGSVFESLLSWADATGNEELPVRVEQHPDYGRCLVAATDVANNEVLLSVPLEQVFSSQAADDLEMHWAAEMALRLLQARYAWQQSSSGSDSGSSSSSSDGGFWGPWIASLPDHVVTPVEFTTQEAEQLVIPSTVQAVLDARWCLEDCYKTLQPQLAGIDCGWTDFLWAVQVLHSRCFYEASSQRHLAVPGIDMCNHSYEPNATVRLMNSPAACQGLDALEEVAPVTAALQSCQSFFQLVAATSLHDLPSSATRGNSPEALRLLFRPDGILAGGQVCISYGPWPSEPLLLLFGFVPGNNPHDSLVLFSDLGHLCDCFMELAACTEPTGPAATTAAVAAAALGNGTIGQSNSSSNGDGGAGAYPLASAIIDDAEFADLVKQKLQEAEEEQAAKERSSTEGQAAGPPGFKDLSIGPTAGVDPRVPIAMQLLEHTVTAAVAQQFESQLKQLSRYSSAAAQDSQQQAVLQHMKSAIAGLVGHRLQQLQQQLQQAAAVADAAVKRGGHGYDDEVVDGDITYQSCAEHQELIRAYCSSKARLVEQLVDKYGFQRHP